MFKRTKVSSCVLLALGSALLVPVSSALAQEQRIEVTGSRIKRIDAEGANPVQVISRKEIERTGAANINDVLQSIPGAGAGLDDRFTNGFAPGGGSVNLRGLGINSTLVLVNGRRMATYPFAQQIGTPQGFQDLNSIPLAAVDRIEVLKDGASAVYGADAVAGVINVILRQDYRGLDVGVSYGRSSKGDGDLPTANLTWGAGDLGTDRYNILVGLNLSKRSEILSKDRSFGSTEDLRPRGGADRRSSYGFPGTIVDNVTGDTLYDVGGVCGPTTQRGGSSRRGAFCRYDRAALGDVLPESEKTGIYARGSFAFNKDTTAFGEVLFTRNKYSSVGWPAGTTDDIGLGTANIPAGAPNNPFPNEAEVRYRFADVGNRGNEGTNDNKRFVLGLKGNLIGWDYETALNINRINIDNLATNNTLNSRLLCLMNPTAAATYAAGGDPGLGGGTLAQLFSATPAYATYFRNELAKCGAAFAKYGYYKFVNPAANVAGTADYLRHDSVRKGESTMDGFDFKVSRDLMALPGGQLGLALGLDTRREEASDIPDIQLQTGDTLAISAAQAFGSRRVSAFYAELNAPITKELEANLAVRRDKYTGNGNYSATSPKIGVRYQPTKALVLRGTASEAFRAPSLFETTPAQQTSFTFGIQDPVKCPVFDENIADCVLDVRRVQQGNPNLKPEKSKSYNLGAVFEASEAVTVSVDYWKIKRKDEIGSFADQTLVDVFKNDPTIVVRNQAGQIVQINAVPVQLNSTKTSGVDLSLTVRNNLGSIGKLSSKLDVSYVDTYVFTTLDSATLQQVPANFNGTYNQPRWRASWDFALDQGAWEYGLSGYAIGGYAGLNTGVVSPHEIWNAGVTYKGVKNLEVRVGVNNLLDRKPPFSDETNGAQGGYNVQLSDPIGRFYTVALKYKFW